MRNPITGRLEDPDEEFMGEIEKSLGVGTRKNEFRHELITRIGAWSIDHPHEKPEWVRVFPKQFSQLREAYFEQNKKLVKKIADDLLVYLTDGAKGMDDEVKARVEQTLKTLEGRFGYCERCARDAIGALVRKRYAAAKA